MKFTVIVVKNRTKETLEKLILENVELGTEIITDNWKSYSGIGQLGFTHKVLNKSEKMRKRKRNIERNGLETFVEELSGESISESENSNSSDDSESSSEKNSSDEESKESQNPDEQNIENSKENEQKKEEEKETPSTSLIESTWSILKSFGEIYSNCVPFESAQDFINEFVFRWECKKNGADMIDQIALII